MDKIQKLFHQNYENVIDSVGIPLPANLDIFPEYADKDNCVLIFKCGVSLKGDLKKQVLSGLTDTKNLIALYIEYLKAGD